uniref:Uncharacterized protein n=1 Tax=Oryza nivara TaxID=4536 RepID=A0A679BAA1_ORYNI|nr:hypothetical protein [Oryza sativa f. spontanea]BBF89755.1 hypothetical protein [Oryza sativa f. spontanea]
MGKPSNVYSVLPSSDFQLVLDGQLCEEEDIANYLPKLRKTVGSVGAAKEAVKPAVKQE